MNSYERLSLRMQGKPTDRPPNMCLTMAFAAKQMKVTYGRYVTDYRLLAEGVWTCYEKFGLDMLCVISDPMREAEGLGAKVIIPEDAVPYSADKRVKNILDIGSLRTIDPSHAARMNDRLEAVRFLQEKSSREVMVVGWVEGAVAESCDLMGVSEFLIGLLDEPEEMHHLLSICAEQAILFAKAQIQAGADMIGIGDAASSLLSPALYQEFALPYQKLLIDRIHNAGAKVKLHICGEISHVLHLTAHTGADILDLDYLVNLENAADILPAEMSICGNFDPVSVLLQGTAPDVKEAVGKCMEIEGKHRNIIAAGCEVPQFTPEKNLIAVKERLECI